MIAEASTAMTTSRTPPGPAATAGAKAAYFAVKPEVSGMPAKASSRNENVAANTGWLRPRPAHCDRCEASEPPWRTMATSPNAATVAKP